MAGPGQHSDPQEPDSAGKKRAGPWLNTALDLDDWRHTKRYKSQVSAECDLQERWTWQGGRDCAPVMFACLVCGS